MKYYAVTDTNVLVSAMLKWNSGPGNVLELTYDGTISSPSGTESSARFERELNSYRFNSLSLCYEVFRLRCVQWDPCVDIHAGSLRPWAFPHSKARWMKVFGETFSSLAAFLDDT